MREKIAELHVAVTVTAGHPEFHLANESIDHILALLREEVEKAENPYAVYDFLYTGFETCRQDVLALLRGGEYHGSN